MMEWRRGLVKVVFLQSESLRNGQIKGGVERETLDRRINGRLEGGEEDSKGEGGSRGVCLPGTGRHGMFTSGRSDFEGC